MFELYTVNEIKELMAKRIKQKRIIQNKTQKEFSLKSGIKLSTYKKFEKEGEGSFENFLLILQALGKIGELEKLLVNNKEFSSKKMALSKMSKQSGHIRQRVKHSNNLTSYSSMSSRNMSPNSMSSNNILDNIKKKKKLEKKNG